jgi:hypothetical protein
MDIVPPVVPVPQASECTWRIMDINKMYIMLVVPIQPQAIYLVASQCVT